MTNSRNKESSVARMFSGLILFVLLAAPASAFADKQVTVRAELDSDLSQSQRTSYANSQYNDYNSDGLTGIIHVGEDIEYLVLEGPASNVDTEITELENNWRTTSVTTVSKTFYPIWNFTSLSSHTETDTHDSASAESFSSYSRKTFRAQIKNNTDTAKLIDDYNGDISSDGLGGVMIIGKNDDWIEVELEGDPAYVDYWIRKLNQDEPRLKNGAVVNNVTGLSSGLYDTFWTHHSDDTQNP